jgi:hypothetical protein
MAEVVDDDDVDGGGMTLVFITLTLREARKVEALLAAWDVTFEVRARPLSRTLFGFARHGAYFFVPTGQAEDLGARLTAAGFGHGVIPFGREAPPE